MLEFTTILVAAFSILQIILFFKLWGMTDNVKKILDSLNANANREFDFPTTVTIKKDNSKAKAVRIENGKVVCVFNIGNGDFERFYSFNEVIFE